MTEPKRISVTKLNKISKSKRIICFGCGKRFFEIITLYSEEPFVNAVCTAMDNNKLLWGKEIDAGGKKYTVHNPEKLRSFDYHDCIILITSDKSDIIYDSIKEYLAPKMQVYRYPESFYGWTGIIFRLVSLFVDEKQLLFRAGSEPHENADEIVHYLSQNNELHEYKVVYLNDDYSQHHGNVRNICSLTIKKKASVRKILDYCLAYGGSKYLIYENEAIKKVNSCQKLIYLNHGTIPLKKVSDIFKQPNDVDYATCPSKECAQIYLDQYGIPENKQIYMMPARVNHMLRASGQLHELMGAGTKKIILWLPTFRRLKGSERCDSKNIDPVALLTNNLLDIDKWLEKYNLLLTIKKHPREKENIILSGVENIVVLDDKKLDADKIALQDILKDADALLTDYSGIAFEYMLLNRPIGYVLTDVSEYNRGFSMHDYEEYMPGRKIYNLQDILQFFEDIKEGRDPYITQREQLKKKLFGTHAYENGAEAFVNFLNKTNAH